MTTEQTKTNKDKKTEEHKAKVLKEVQSYKISSTHKISKSGDYLNFILEINKPLRETIKKACIESTEEQEIYVGYNPTTSEREYLNTKRYKIKKVIYSLINYTTDYPFIFNKELLDTGKLKIKFYDLSRIETIISGVKTTINIILQQIIKEQFPTEIKFNLSLE